MHSLKIKTKKNSFMHSLKIKTEKIEFCTFIHTSLLKKMYFSHLKKTKK